MNTMMNVLSVILGISYVMVLIISTAAIIPAALILIIAKADQGTWKDAIRLMYVDIPADYIMMRI